MLRTRSHKLLLHHDKIRSQFFDFDDPLEKRNVFHEPAYKQLVEEYIERLAAILTSTPQLGDSAVKPKVIFPK